MAKHLEQYNLDGRKECIVELEEKFGVHNVMIFCYMMAEKCLYKAAGKQEIEQMEDAIVNAQWYFDYVNELATKWRTDMFDLEHSRLRQQIEKSIKDAKREVRRKKKEKSA